MHGTDLREAENESCRGPLCFGILLVIIGCLFLGLFAEETIYLVSGIICVSCGGIIVLAYFVKWCKNR